MREFSMMNTGSNVISISGFQFGCEKADMPVTPVTVIDLYAPRTARRDSGIGTETHSFVLRSVSSTFSFSNVLMILAGSANPKISPRVIQPVMVTMVNLQSTVRYLHNEAVHKASNAFCKVPLSVNPAFEKSDVPRARINHALIIRIIYQRNVTFRKFYFSHNLGILSHTEKTCQA